MDDKPNLDLIAMVQKARMAHDASQTVAGLGGLLDRGQAPDRRRSPDSACRSLADPHGRIRD